MSGGAVYCRTYDENGNLRSFTDPLGATTTWVRDARGRTLRVSDPLGRTTVIEREPDGHIRRVTDPAGGVTEVTRTPGVLYWTDPIGATFEARVEARGLITETVAPNGARTRFLHDAHGNVIQKIDGTGAVTEHVYDYWGRCLSAFGAKVKEGGRTTTPLRFPGQYEDEETGLVYNRYRYFDPAMGRYLSADPAGLDGGFNGFDYAGNAPTRFVDPSGLMPFSTVRNAAGKNPEGKDFTDPKNRRGVPGDIEGKSQRERGGPNAEAHREKFGRDDAITEAVKNAQRAREPQKTPTGDTTCSEVDALHKMARQIRAEGNAQRTAKGKPEMTNEEVRAELQKRFRNGATLETTNKTGEGMAPCPMCAQIFRELGLHPANIGEDAKGGVIGPNDETETKVNKMGRWDGNITQSSQDRHSRQRNIRTTRSTTPPFTT